MSSIDDIVGYWFGDVSEAKAIDMNASAVRRWFGENQAQDREIAARFEDDLNAALAGERSDWEGTPRGALALALLLDAFPRSMYRGTSRELVGDALAQGVTLRAIDGGKDAELGLFERAFLYMPLMHSENLSHQKKALRLFETLVKTAKQTTPANADFFVFAYGYERKHYVIVERYGRFPHRNAMLGRASTPEELDFLTQPGSSF